MRGIVACAVIGSACLLAVGCSSSEESSTPGVQDPRADAATSDTTDSSTPDTNVEDTSQPDASQDASPDQDQTPDSDLSDTSVPDADNPDTLGDGSTPYTVMGTLTVDCDVPFILDGGRLSEMTYMTSHFSDLIQQYGITGTVGGVDITQYPEKMYYGSHAPASADPNNVVSLTQISMQTVTSPQYSVKVDFIPDTNVTTGATWQVGLELDQASALIVRHNGNSLCLYSVAQGGSLTFAEANNTTAVEGGSFKVSGTMTMVVPSEIPDLCDAFAGTNSPCCE